MSKCAACGKDIREGLWFCWGDINGPMDGCAKRIQDISDGKSTERLVFVPERLNIHVTETSAFTGNTSEPGLIFHTPDRPLIDQARYPHACPRCGKPAYIGLGNVECSGGCE